MIRTAVEGISRMGRPTQGVRLMNLRGDDTVSSIARVSEPQAAPTPTPRQTTRAEDLGRNLPPNSEKRCACTRRTSSIRSTFRPGWTSSICTSGRSARSPASRRCSSTTGRPRPASRRRQEAAHVRHALGRARHADQAGQGQGDDLRPRSRPPGSSRRAGTARLVRLRQTASVATGRPQQTHAPARGPSSSGRHLIVAAASSLTRASHSASPHHGAATNPAASRRYSTISS